MMSNAVRTLSIWYTQSMVIYGGWDAYNHIADGLFLGMIPIKESVFNTAQFNDQHKQIIAFAKKTNPDRPLKLVVSVIEPGELKGEGFGSIKSMVSPEDWKAEKVENHILVKMADFTADVVTEDAIKAITKMRECIVQGGSVYVHCKAGRSRSAMMCAIYLALYGDNPLVKAEMPLDDTIKLLIKKRKQVELDALKIQKAQEIIAEMQKSFKHVIQSTIPDPSPVVLQNISQYLIDEKKLVQNLNLQSIKDSILKLDVTRELMTYTTKPCCAMFSDKNVCAIKRFFNLLNEPASDKWFSMLMDTKPGGLLSSFINDNKSEAAVREKLVTTLQHEVVHRLCETLACDQQDFLNVLQIAEPKSLDQKLSP
jgi:hypothetical protein